MKNKLLLSVMMLSVMTVIAQNQSFRFGITSGASIQHYNGNLGNSFFQFNTTCFAGGTSTFGVALNKSFDANLGLSIGDFGYCQTDQDKNRIVAVSLRCPGCKDRLGMGELRSRMYSASLNVKYKFANGRLLPENAKLAPYVYAGAGIVRLVDNMKLNCVNAGDHFTVNAGAGVKYNFCSRFNVGYNLGLGCFMTKKVYYTYSAETGERDADNIRMEKRKDLYLQHTLFLGVNF